MILIKNITQSTLFLVFLCVTSVFVSCNSKTQDDNSVQIQDEDLEAKKQLQGTWISELEGNAMFTMKGDTLYYNDSLSIPVAFYVRHDSLIIRNHKEVRYAIKRLNSTQFHFINAEGDEVELVKSNHTEPTLSKGEYKGAITLNQGKMVKNDTIIFYKDVRYHAYTQVNPTTYKVYRTSTNDDGLTVESLFYDNLVYIALYEGQHKIFGQNILKKEFSQLVPQAYLEQAILSEIQVQGPSADGIRFTAILSIPDSYTNYRVNIDITPEGKKKLSI